ncbi:MAG TPA: hypothetical protein VI541_03735 [Actinomycetota bacterium]|nr:hypothetical protein [Actinomycetota bacterium]
MITVVVIVGFFLVITGVLHFSIWAEKWLAVSEGSTLEFETDTLEIAHAFFEPSEPEAIQAA